jgi:hypothetical protein
MQTYFAQLASEALTHGPRRLPGDGETAPGEGRGEAVPPPPPKRPSMETKVEAIAAPIAAPPPKRSPPRRRPRQRSARPRRSVKRRNGSPAP